MSLRPGRGAFGPGSTAESWLLLAPFLAGVTVLVAGPALLTVVLALFEADLVRASVFRGWGNFAELAGDAVFHTALRNSCIYIAGAVPLRALAAVGMALLLHAQFRGAGTYRTATYLPTAIPDVPYALAWLWILNPLYGPLNLALAGLGLDGPAWLSDPWAARAGLILISAFTVGEGFLIALAARREVPAEMYELAALEGAGRWQTLRRVTMPLLGPTLDLLVLRDTIYSFQSSFVPALVITDGGPPEYATTFLPLFIYRNGFEHLRFGYAASATVVMLLLTVVLIGLQYLVLRRWRYARVA
jgi:multiple sugar transport system permease protein